MHDAARQRPASASPASSPGNASSPRVTAHAAYPSLRARGGNSSGGAYERVSADDLPQHPHASSASAAESSMRQNVLRVVFLLVLLALMALWLRMFQAPWTSSEVLWPRGTRYDPSPALPAVPGTPLPQLRPGGVDVQPVIGTTHYVIPRSSFAGVEWHDSFAADFAVYVPYSLYRSEPLTLRTLSPSSPLYRSYPLVLTLHGRTGNSTTECDSEWSEWGERFDWIVVCPTMATSARADYESLAASSVFLQSIMDTVLGHDDPALPSGGLSTVVDRSKILLTAHSAGGYSMLSFMLNLPNHWTAVSCRSCNFWSEHYHDVLRPQAHAVAREAVRTRSWLYPEHARTPGVEPTPEGVSELFWSSFLSQRAILVQVGDSDHVRILDQVQQLQLVLRDDFGARHIRHDIMPDESHHSRSDITARWWKSKIKPVPASKLT